jgi:tRNA dimethylallyltransferase
MTIGTAVPSKKQLKSITHHFIQNKSIHDYYNASMFEFEALDLLHKLFEKYHTVLMAGGSGMYIDAVCYGIDDLPTVDMEIRDKLTHRLNTEGIESLRKELKIIDPEYFSKTDLKNPKRILKALEIYFMTGKPYSSFLTKRPKTRNFKILKIGLNIERQELYNRINARVDKMIESGLVEEVKRLLPDKKLNALNTVGYKELFDYLEGKTNLEKAVELIKRNTRHYARKQITWFNRYDDIKWFKPVEIGNIIKKINDSLY